jgi:PhzF family phenazine biosynthesis protein
MELQIFQVDAFTDHVFGGNPACVVPLPKWLDDKTLLSIAAENAVAETAFFVADDGSYHLRWFTPDIEMDLCGHATLATAHVIKKHLNVKDQVVSFLSKSGTLTVSNANDRYTLDLPSRMPVIAELPGIIKDSIDRQPKKVLKSRDYILVYDHEEDIRDIIINRQVLDSINLDPGGVVITSRGKQVDFVSRFFTPQSTIFEDPVTGSAHCSLIPFWSHVLHKTEMTAFQLSDRVGKLWCVNNGERVLISGYAKTYLAGNIFVG